jgi:hypothetical protein
MYTTSVMDEKMRVDMHTGSSLDDLKQGGHLEDHGTDGSKNVKVRK